MPESPATPDVEPLLAGLARRRVQVVLAGSVAAMAHGLPLAPGDLDVVPALDPGNLGRLAEFLREIGARPKHVPGWAAGPSEEECQSWTPEPADEKRLDHRFVTRHGELDVVPRNAGPYAELIGRAIPMAAFGLVVPVAAIPDIVAGWRRWNRPRDRERVRRLLELGVRAAGPPPDVTRRLTVRPR